MKVTSIKQKTECIIRTVSSAIGFAMSLGGVVGLLLDRFASGFVLCIFAIIFVAMAIGYRQIELAMAKIEVKLKR
jgi:hypothetical protein